MSPSLLNEIQTSSQVIERLLPQVTSRYFEMENGLYDKIIYTFPDIGLRVRPFLVRMGYELGGGDFSDVQQVAAAVELLQVSTLVTDDILDDSIIRNDQPSVFAKLGEKEAILIGELLHSLSSQIFITTFSNAMNRAAHMEALELFEFTYREICVGQYLDLQSESKKSISEEEYLDMIKKTTAIFIQSSLKIGAILSGVEENILKKLTSYGLALGYAYQIRDDIIDMIGEEEFTGKPYAGDIRQKKKRLPLIHAQAHGTRESRSKISSILKKEKLKDVDVDIIVEIIRESGSIDYSIERTKQFSKQAINEISNLENSPQKKLLIELAEMVSTFES